MSDSPVRIAFCITELDPGGAERALVRIVTGLDRGRWDPHVYCLASRGPLADDLEAAGISVTCFNARSSWDFRIVSRLTKELKRFRPEILQTFLFHANLAGRFAAWRANVPIVVSGVRVVEPDARWRMRLDRWTSGLVDRTICVSRGVADRYREIGFRDEQLTVVPNGVDFERFSNAAPADLSAFGIPQDGRTILSVGRLHPQKGQTHLLNAVHRLVSTSRHADNVHLLFVGDGPDRERLQADVRRLGLESRVHLAGWQPGIPSLLRAAHVFVLASEWEGMPNALLEAMAAGVVCVATNVEGVAELIIDGATGLLVEPSDGAALAKQMTRLFTDPALASRLAKAGQERVRTQFTWENSIRGFESVWNELLTRKQSDPGEYLASEP